ncbi:hypothetical protein WJX72_012557 [[Myrmecia] bisecta]|uniref:Cilia- and flagella-associated protein 74 n=1 Tax=[Myrmecia] bisecta TaxID=41462 RepID=A0AAW1QTD4_9CHLO
MPSAAEAVVREGTAEEETDSLMDATVSVDSLAAAEAAEQELAASLAALEQESASELEYLKQLWGEDEMAGPPRHTSLSPPLLTQSRPTYQELMASSRKVSITKPAAERQSELQQIKALQASINRADTLMAGEGAALSAVSLKVQKVQQLMGNLENEMRDLREEEAQLLQRQPVPAGRLRTVRQWLAERSQALQQQNFLLAQLHQEEDRAERALRAAEAAVMDVVDSREGLDAMKQAKLCDQEQAAAALRTREMNAVTGYQRVRAHNEAQRAAQAEHAEQERQRAIAAAREGRRFAAERIQAHRAAIQASTEQVKQLKDGVREQRTQAVMQLRRDIQAARGEIAERAELHRMRARQLAEAQAQEFSQLLEAGQNPYEVFRRRKEEAKVARLKQQIASNVRRKEAAIAAQMVVEEEAHKRAIAMQKFEKEIEAQFQKEMGSTAREARMDSFMRAHTASGQTLLDPTGRLPVPPSQAAAIKTWGFGLGKASPTILAKYQRLDPEVAASDLLLPRKYRQQEQAAAEVRQLDGSLDRPALSPRRAAANQENAGAPASPGKLAVMPLSVFEQKALDKSRQRHKQNITKKQVVMGREFQGPAFLPTPATVVFKDFEVGQSYSQTITLTNVSYSKNTFKVLPLPDEVCTYFDIMYKLPGYISAGLTCEMTIVFTPKVNQDIQTCIPLLAETGPLSIPLRCLIKRAVLSVTATELDFDCANGVLLGDSASATFAIVNDGALDVDYEMRPPSAEARPALPDASDEPSTAGPAPPNSCFIATPLCGTLRGYSRATISVEFKPLRAGLFRRQLDIRFRAKADRKLVLEPLGVGLKAAGRTVPVTVQRSLIDFKCCVYDQTYRDTVVVHNRGKSAVKVSLVKRAEMVDFFEFQPSFGYCQGGDDFAFTITFRASPELLHKCKKFVTDLDQEVLEIPMKINVAGQALPVEFRLRVQLTTAAISFSPACLDFGPCNLGEQTGMQVHMTNHSRLPQQFGFQQLPKGVQVEPSAGYGLLLPGETCAQTVLVRPAISNSSHFSLTCRGSLGGTYALPCTTHGRQTAITCSHNLIKMPATAVGDTASVAIVLTNTSKAPRAFEFAVPACSSLRVSPQLDSLGQPASTGQEPRSQQPGSASGQGGEDLTDDAALSGNFAASSEDAQATEPIYHWQEVPLHCHIQPLDAGSPSEILHLQVVTCAVAQQLHLAAPAAWNAEKACYMLDFGSVAVGQRKLLGVLLSNSGSQAASVTADSLDPTSIFSTVNAVRAIPPGGAFKLLLDFLPQAKTLYQEMLTLRSPETKLRLLLVGEGIAPAYKVEPAEALQGLDLGDVYPGEQLEKTLTLTNTGTFGLTYATRMLGPAAEQHSGPSPFYCKPEEGSIAVGQSQTVTVVFRPDRAAPGYQDILQIGVPGGQKVQIGLKGRCWEEGAFLAGVEYKGPVDDPFLPALPPSIPDKGSQASPPLPLEVQVTLQPAAQGSTTASATIYVGSLKSSLGGSAAELTLDALPEAAKQAGWKVDNPKVSAAAGEKKPLMFTFTPPPQPAPGTLAYFGLREWVELRLTGLLKGGTPSRDPAGRKVVLNLRCFLEGQAQARKLASDAS